MDLFPIYRLVLPSRTRCQPFVYMSVCPTCTNDAYYNIMGTKATNSKVWANPRGERTFHRLKSFRNLDLQLEGHPLLGRQSALFPGYQAVVTPYGYAIPGIIQTAVFDRVQGQSWVPSLYTCHLCREPKFARPRLFGRGTFRNDPRLLRKNALHWVYLPEFPDERHPVRTVFVGSDSP